MSTFEVRPVRTRRERKDFLNLPWRLYQNDPVWIPPLRKTQKEMTGFARHPFYEYAEREAYIAYRGKEPIGRVLAIINHRHNEVHKETRGFFGFFECVDDADVAAALFDAARAYLGEKRIEKLRGPVNPSLNYEVGLLVEGFDDPPMFMMTYNPPFYGRLIEEYGFVKTQDLYAFVADISMLDSVDPKLQFVIDEVKRRFNIQVRKLDRKRFHEDAATWLRIYNDSLPGTWGFVPMSEGEVAHGVKAMRKLIVPEITSIAEVDGKSVASCFGMLDYNGRIKEMNGRLFPFGWMKLFYGRRKIKRCRLLATNVTPEFQRWGLPLVLLNRILFDALDWGIEEGEFSWVAESNHLSRKTLERGGARRSKTYRVYDYGPAEGADSPSQP